MPIYEYQCEHCGHKFEAIQKMSDKPLTDCPECKEDRLKKLVSASRFVLKGQGWYETDFKHKKPEVTDKTEGSKKTDAAEASTDKSGAAGSKQEAKETSNKSGDKTASSSNTSTSSGSSSESKST